MTNETTQQGASGYNSTPPTHKSFPEEPGKVLDNSDEGNDNDAKPVNARDDVLDGIEAKIAAQREAEMASVVEGTPPEPVAADESRHEEEVREEGLASKEAMHPPAEKVENDHLPEEYRDDPLADYIVMDEAQNKPMFVTKVNGQEKYIPLDRARQQLQKHEAAEVRLQNAAEQEKRLQEREAQILASEQALKQKHTEQPVSPPSPLPVADVSDQDLDNEAQGVIQSLFNGTESEAVEKLAHVLKTLKAPAAPQQAPIDAEAIVQRTAQVVRTQDAAEAARQDAEDGLAKFAETYPDVNADKALFNYADVMTDVIAAEWKEEGRQFRTSELMMEAGKRTTEWVQSMKAPESGNPQPNTDRHERKRNLRPMPNSQSQPMARQEAEPDQTPTDAVTEMRKARGQA